MLFKTDFRSFKRTWKSLNTFFIVLLQSSLIACWRLIIYSTEKNSWGPVFRRLTWKLKVKKQKILQNKLVLHYLYSFPHKYHMLGILLERAMAPHSSTLAWKTPWTEEPGGLQSMGSLRVGDDWATSLLLFTFIHWRRKWQPTPVSLPGESQERGSLVGCRLWGRTESDTTEAI